MITIIQENRNHLKGFVSVSASNGLKSLAQPCRTISRRTVI